METKRFTFYTCSMCDVVSTERPKLTMHVNRIKRCAGAEVLEVPADVSFPAGSFAPVPRVDVDDGLKLEKKVVDRVPSGLVDLESIDTTGIDERTDYLFEHHDLIRTIFNVLDDKPVRTHPVIHMAIKMYDHLWGSKAPEKFQSVFVHKRVVHVINAIEDPEDLLTVDVLKYQTKEEIDELIVNVWQAQRDFAEMVCSRYPNERFGEAAKMYHNLTGGKAPMTVTDVLERNETYQKYRKKHPDIVRLTNDFRKEFRKSVHKVRLK